MIIEAITGSVTAAGTTETALTMWADDSKNIRAFKNGTARLLDVFSFTQGSGRLIIASPNMHDPNNGIELQHTSGDPSPVAPSGTFFQTFNEQEILTLKATGSATAGDQEPHTLLLQYDDVPGLAGRFIDETTLALATEEIVGVRVSYTAGTGTNYGTAVPINTTVDNFIANRVYAVLGVVSQNTQGVVTIKAAETGNVRIAMPCIVGKKDLTKDYLVQLSRRTGLPTIPVFNSANKGNVQIQTVNNENAASPVFSVMLALLKKDYFPE